jgi:hypothetical protein
VSSSERFVWSSFTSLTAMYSITACPQVCFFRIQCHSMQFCCLEIERIPSSNTTWRSWHWYQNMVPFDPILWHFSSADSLTHISLISSQHLCGNLLSTLFSRGLSTKDCTHFLFLPSKFKVWPIVISSHSLDTQAVPQELMSHRFLYNVIVPLDK